MGVESDHLLPRPHTARGTRGSGQWDTWHVSGTPWLSPTVGSTWCGHCGQELLAILRLLTARIRLLPPPPGNNGLNIRPSEAPEVRSRSQWWQPSTLSPELFHVSCPAKKPIIIEQPICFSTLPLHCLQTYISMKTILQNVSMTLSIIILCKLKFGILNFSYHTSI